MGFAGEWSVTGTGGAELSLDFDLPDSMSTSDSLAFLRILFTATDASYDDESGGGQTSPAGVIDPAGPTVLESGRGWNADDMDRRHGGSAGVADRW